MKNNPIKRSTLTQPKERGGLGLIDIALKSKCILTSTFIKSFNNPDQITFMMEYYNNIRIAQVFNKQANMPNVAYNGTEYYNQIVDIIRSCIHCPKFPKISSKSIYEYRLPIENPRIESMYDNSIFNWKTIWRNISFKYIQINEREIVYKYMHEILPTKKRMASIGQGSSECKFCGMEESNIHISYQCVFYKPVIEWFKGLLFKCLGFNPNMMKILMFDMSNTDRVLKNTCIILTATYLTNIWLARKAELPPIATIKLIKGKIIYNKCINLHRLKDKFNLFFTENYRILGNTDI